VITDRTLSATKSVAVVAINYLHVAEAIDSRWLPIDRVRGTYRSTFCRTFLRCPEFATEKVASVAFESKLPSNLFQPASLATARI
jgi:hypothetical protein